MAEAVTITPRQRMKRAVGLTVITASGIYCLMASYQAAVSNVYSGWHRFALPVGLFLAAFACFGMAADAYDYWMRSRKFDIGKVRMMQSAVLVSLMIAFLLTVFIIKTALFLWLTPAVLIYIVFVARPTNAAGQAEVERRVRKSPAAARSRDKASVTRGRPVPKQRQRRGGKKHK